LTSQVNFELPEDPILCFKQLLSETLRGERIALLSLDDRYYTIHLAEFALPSSIVMPGRSIDLHRPELLQCWDQYFSSLLRIQNPSVRLRCLTYRISRSITFRNAALMRV
jgi:hypothetical protein